VAGSLPLAEVLARHFDNADEAREFGGIRIPVFVRYEAFASSSTAPRPIELDEAEHNLVVAIGTHNLAERLANDQAWCAWFDDLSARFAKRGKIDKFVVISLESSVLEVGGFPAKHAIRAYQWPSDLQSTVLERHPEAGAVFCYDIFINAEGHEYGRLIVPSELKQQSLLNYQVMINAQLTYKNRFMPTPNSMVRACVYREVGPFRGAI
jgi:hypothetical protein